LIDCPRKFYLENSLKLKSPDQKNYQAESHQDPEDLASVLKSSSDRGTFIHQQIAKGVTRNFVVPLESFLTKERDAIEWALEELKKLIDNFDMISEEPIKFKFFNFMISGTPDLLLLPKADETPQIWDFKTGQLSHNKLARYWLQLKVYAYAMYKLGRVLFSSEIALKLVFVDEKKILCLKTNWKECQSELFPLWRLQNEPWKINLDHCHQCSYGDICPR
jgi:hypothetical protein